jgi:hypothetical protein
MMQNHQFAILLPLAVGVGAVECTIFVHALALATTVNLFRYEKRRGHLGADALKNLAIIVLVISVAFVAHLAEIGLWAILLVPCGEFQELGTAYCHSAVNYTTWATGICFLPPRGVCWDRWRQRTEPSCSVFRPQWSLPRYSAWFWPGLRISETDGSARSIINLYYLARRNLCATDVPFVRVDWPLIRPSMICLSRSEAPESPP